MALCQTANDAINALKPSSAKTNGLDMEQGHQQRGRFRSLAAVLQNGPIECRDLLMTSDGLMVSAEQKMFLNDKGLDSVRGYVSGSNDTQ